VKSTLNVTFVHIGAALPKYLLLNLRSTAERFPNISIVLITDSKPNLSDFPQNIEIVNYVRTPQTADLASNLMHDKTFRNNFWFHSFERLIAVLQLQIERPQKKVLHIESDVLLFPTFPFDSFENETLARWPKQGVDLDTASIFFVPSKEIARLILDKIYDILKKDTLATDMKCLPIIAKSLGSLFEYLPTKPPVGHEGSSSNAGLFDALGWGMYFAGIDPRNNYGLTVISDLGTFQVGECELYPPNYSFVATDDGFKVSYEGKDYDLHNLHIHSKNLRLLAGNWKLEIDSILEAHKRKRRYYEFDFSLLIHLVIDNFRRRTLLSYLRKSYRVLKF
jgi:hypothetical protein